MRQDKKRTAHNLEIKNNMRKLIKDLRRAPSQDKYNKVASSLDKAVKTHFIHANKASRLKSRLSKLIIASK